MDSKEFHSYMTAQAELIRKHVEKESRKAGRNLGNEAAIDWVNKFAKNFRASWEGNKSFNQEAN